MKQLETLANQAKSTISKFPKERRTDRIHIPISKDLKVKLIRKAREYGMTVTFFLNCVIKEVVEDEST